MQCCVGWLVLVLVVGCKDSKVHVGFREVRSWTLSDGKKGLERRKKVRKN